MDNIIGKVFTKYNKTTYKRYLLSLVSSSKFLEVNDNCKLAKVLGGIENALHLSELKMKAIDGAEFFKLNDCRSCELGGHTKDSQINDIADIKQGEKGYAEPKNNKLLLMVFVFKLMFIFGSCFSSSKTNNSLENDNALKCISTYIKSTTEFVEYEDLRNSFHCFYSNAYKANREFYTHPIDAILLDSLMIFSPNRDSVLLFYLKDGTKHENGGFFNFSYLFAYRQKNKWKFYDRSCPDSGYKISKYTKIEVQMNHYLQLAINEEWLLNSISCEFDPNYTSIACKNYCGPCRLERDLKINPEAIKFYKPIPDSLFGCK